VVRFKKGGDTHVFTGKRYTDDFKTQMIELYNSGQSLIKLSPRIWHSQRDTIQMDQWGGHVNGI